MGTNNKMRKELKYEILGLGLMAAALFTLISLYGGGAGAVGKAVARFCLGAAGEGRSLLPVLLGYYGWRLVKERDPLQSFGKLYGGVVLLAVFLTFLHLLLVPLDRAFRDTVTAGLAGDGGGMVGALLAWACWRCFGYAGSYVILGMALVAGVILFTEIPAVQLGRQVARRVGRVLKKTGRVLDGFLFTKEEEKINRPSPVIIDHTVPQEKELPREEEMAPSGPPALAEAGTGEARQHAVHQLSLHEVASFQLPPVSILSKPARPKTSRSHRDIAENIRILEETLDNFGVKAKVLQVSRGPAITRYELQPAAGVKVSRIVSLADDIALSMAAPAVRIEAPIPGKAALGIEIPNKEIATVHLRELLETKEFTQSASRLTIALGKDIAGNAVVADLVQMPHLLIAGATGAGKSVCLNTLIASILFKSSPDEVKFLMIDPKMVELTTYNGIPHLLVPVITDPKKAALSLKWLVREMERRYELFAAAGVRDITRYNSIFRTREYPGERTLPLIVVVIDELADLMMVAPTEVEDAICRLAQMARAAGIHLVVATQRPSVDVITGLIKANIPSRISFAVSSQTDSRTILDTGGAEKLLGRGDMLFLPVGAAKPVRLQGAYLSDKDVEALASYWRRQAVPTYQDDILSGEAAENGAQNDDDELFPQAVEIILRTGHASISLLQRRLHIGYARAARLIDMMERRGLIGGYEGSKPRAVLMTWEQYQKMIPKAR
ncbi:MAG: cell division FtsK/SpoIIIE [Clostridia bacterium 62_21]|nr:MAG: cell division FtsK/SpoIIIE [Clostridia bacterium 62_21]